MSANTLQVPTERSLTEPAPVNLTISFLALDGNPIEGLDVRLKIAAVTQTLKTDSDGFLAPISAKAGEDIEVAVKRFDGTFKVIDTDIVPEVDSTWNFASPKLLIETTTEEHVGSPGDAEQSIPTSNPGDLGDLHAASMEGESNYSNEGRNHPAATTAPATTAAAPSLTKPKPKSHIAKAPPQRIASTSNAPKPIPTPGRDKNGNPLAVIEQKIMDWWGSWRMPSFNLWGATGSATQRAQAPQTPVSQSTGMTEQLKAFLDFAKAQTEYLYTEGTAGVLAKMANGKFDHKAGEKAQNDSEGLCYTYVKVALTHSGVISGILAADRSREVQESASLAGPVLIDKGFREVTNEVPDARWAAAGDVIVYSWSDKGWTKRRKKYGNPNVPNYGHIDIRDYETYISDFIPPIKPSGVVSYGAPKWSDYDSQRIYRKVFDILPTLRIKAFLRCIRDFECTEEKDDAQRYNILHKALPGADARRFSSYKTHPWDTVPANIRGTATAAGAYQIVYSTWKSKFDEGLIVLPSGADAFSPIVQDRIAVMALEFRKVLHLIRTGKIHDALNYRHKDTLSIYNEWTSLPGGSQNHDRVGPTGKPLDESYFLSIFEVYLTEEKRKVGLL